jgi:hypothetical protein
MIVQPDTTMSLHWTHMALKGTPSNLARTIYPSECHWMNEQDAREIGWMSPQALFRAYRNHAVAPQRITQIGRLCDHTRRGSRMGMQTRVPWESEHMEPHWETIFLEFSSSRRQRLPRSHIKIMPPRVPRCFRTLEWTRDWASR